VNVQRVLLFGSGVLGALAVLLGAFGAHGLKSRFAALADGADRRGWWETAAHYHLVHALAIGLAAMIVASRKDSTAGVVSGFSFAAGILLFSGSLYVMALTGVRALGAVTPLGGLAFIAGWVALAIAALGLR
jgi:uncharacterized membrane protein YgdD (TMEM256/DUF423 family)